MADAPCAGLSGAPRGALRCYCRPRPASICWQARAVATSAAATPTTTSPGSLTCISLTGVAYSTTPRPRGFRQPDGRVRPTRRPVSARRARQQLRDPPRERGEGPDRLYARNRELCTSHFVWCDLAARCRMSSELVERMVPDGLWELFQRVVPPAPVRPQGGGRRGVDGTVTGRSWRRSCSSPRGWCVGQAASLDPRRTRQSG